MLFVALVLIINILCSCAIPGENAIGIHEEPIVVLTEEDKKLSRIAAESFMNAICKFDFVNANQYIKDSEEITESEFNVDISEIKQEMLDSIKGSPLDDYRMEELIDKIFSQFSYEILSYEEQENKYIYKILMKMPDLNRFTQEIPNSLNDDVLEDVIADCLYKGVITEADLHKEYLSEDKQQALMSVAIDKVIEMLNKEVDRCILSAEIELTLIKQNDRWLIERNLSNMEEFLAIINYAYNNE